MSKTVPFQTTQFNVQKQFYFKQFRLAKLRSLDVKTVLLQSIQFSICTQFSSIWSIDRTQLGANTPSKSGPEKDGIEGVLHIPKGPALLEPHHQIV